MISLAEARDTVLSTISSLPERTVDVAESLGLVLAESVRSQHDVPPFNNSAMDGFAVRSADVSEPGARLEVIGTIAAGTVADDALGDGQAYRIMTGAAMPDGADTVAMVELCRVEQAELGEVVVVAEAIESDRHIRRAGSDTSADSVVLDAGTVVSPAVIGLLNTVGVTEVLVTPRPVVGVFSTGDELVTPPAPLEPGQIYDSNRAMLLATLQHEGFDGIDLGLVPDDPGLIKATLADAVGRCDAIITSGGVSMGDFDYVKTVLAEMGDMAWMQVAIKPAKPLAFGTLQSGDRRVPVFGLPGNPVSSLVSFEVFARPALRKMSAHPQIERWLAPARLVEPIERRNDEKVHFVRVVVSEADEQGVVWAKPFSQQSSHQMRLMAQANALAVIPPGASVDTGDWVDVLILI